MKNPFSTHPRESVGETWWEHCSFSSGIGLRLLWTSICFMTHSIFPFIGPKKKYNLEDSSEWLNSKNENRELKRIKKIETNVYGDDDWATPPYDE